MDTIIEVEGSEKIIPQCFVCSQEEGPFMDPMPCICRGSTALHQTCYDQLKLFFTTCSICHTDYPAELRDGLPIQRGFVEGTTYRYEATFDENDDYHGLYKEWHTNGTLIKECIWENGYKNGSYKTWYPSGTLQKECTYKNGNKDGIYKYYYASGRIKEESNYFDGDQHGSSKLYFENGKLAEECFYMYDVCEGISRTYNENGNLHVCCSFKNGKLDGYMYTFNNDMKIISREFYVSDMIVEVIRY